MLQHTIMMIHVRGYNKEIQIEDLSQQCNYTESYFEVIPSKERFDRVSFQEKKGKAVFILLHETTQKTCSYYDGTHA